jgi:hypothetical protein
MIEISQTVHRSRQGVFATRVKREALFVAEPLVRGARRRHLIVRSQARRRRRFAKKHIKA